MTWLCLCQRCEPATVRSHRVCVEVWSSSAVAAWSAVQSAEWSASILEGLFLSVSDPLLPDCHQQRQSAAGAAPVERSQSLCAGDIKACLSERRIGKWGGGLLSNSTCCALVCSCIFWVCLCASPARGGKLRAQCVALTKITTRDIWTNVAYLRQAFANAAHVPKFAALQPFSDATELNSLNQTHYGKVTRNKYLFKLCYFQTVMLYNIKLLFQNLHVMLSQFCFQSWETEKWQTKLCVFGSLKRFFCVYVCDLMNNKNSASLLLYGGQFT